MTARYRARVATQGHHLRRLGASSSCPSACAKNGSDEPLAVETTNAIGKQGEPTSQDDVPLSDANAVSVADTKCPNIWAVVPCKGRLSFLEQTAPRLLAEPRAKLCLVDYSCPDQAGNWLERNFPQAIAEGRACVERVPNQKWFSKTRAHNAGARRAIAEGAQYLCFLDADTLIEPGFWRHLEAEAKPQRFLVAGKHSDGTDVPSMTGLLLVSAAGFCSVNGFDERFQGWGGEDIELRLRLHLLGGLDFGFVPLPLAQPILHDDSLRSQFYTVRNITVSNRENMDRLRHIIAKEWLGRCKRELSSAGPLWYRPPFVPRVAPQKSRLNHQEPHPTLPLAAPSRARLPTRRSER